MKLENKIEEVRKERDSIQQEYSELKVQLHLAEDRNDSLQNLHQDATRKLKEGF